MAITIQSVSPLFKIKNGEQSVPKFSEKTQALKGERVSFQILLRNDGDTIPAFVGVESEISEHVKVYVEKNVYVDMVATVDVSEDGYLISSPDVLPDVLVPIEEQNGTVFLSRNNTVLWVKVDLPENIAQGSYDVHLNVALSRIGNINNPISETLSITHTIDVISAVLPEQKLIYTRWFYADCIADYHNVEIYSQKHWELIEKYIEAATDVGINMMLVPIHTPPLDTEVGTARHCVQLIDIEKKGERYEFNFEKFRRFIDICKRKGVKYYEMAHLFSQWGAACSPNIMVSENGKKDYMFGWHTKADSPEYIDFLSQYLSALSSELRREGIEKSTYFHISDEPKTDNIDNYARAKNIIKALLDECKILDALSDVEFYENGLVECPATSITRLDKFLPLNVKELWTYYCCWPQTIYTNCFLAMPLPRVRILGYLLYKYDIKGFLHWGLNYYNSQVSRYMIDPYHTTSSDGAFPSGDAYIIYPARNGAYGSIRGEVTYQAIQDMRICTALEAHIGREGVVAMIDEYAGAPLTPEVYPCAEEFFVKLRTKMIEMISSFN